MKVYHFHTTIKHEGGTSISGYSAFAETETEAMLKIKGRYGVPAETELKLLQVDEDRRTSPRDRRTE